MPVIANNFRSLANCQKYNFWQQIRSLFEVWDNNQI